MNENSIINDLQDLFENPGDNQDNIAAAWWTVINNALNTLTFKSPSTQYHFTPTILTKTLAETALSGYLQGYTVPDLGLVRLGTFFSTVLFPVAVAVTVSGTPTQFHVSAASAVPLPNTPAAPWGVISLNNDTTAREAAVAIGSKMYDSIRTVTIPVTVLDSTGAPIPLILTAN